jgi:hypothetical protein
MLVGPRLLHDSVDMMGIVTPFLRQPFEHFFRLGIRECGLKLFKVIIHLFTEFCDPAMIMFMPVLILCMSEFSEVVPQSLKVGRDVTDMLYRLDRFAKKKTISLFKFEYLKIAEYPDCQRQADDCRKTEPQLVFDIEIIVKTHA